jgi:hypothetical protein
MSAQTEPGHSSADHMKADGTPDMRFKEVSPVPHLPSLLFFGLVPHLCIALRDHKLTVQNGGGEHGNQGGRLSGGFEEDGDGTSRLVTEGSGEDGTYKPSAHGGKKEDGGEDKRESSRSKKSGILPDVQA